MKIKYQSIGLALLATVTTVFTTLAGEMLPGVASPIVPAKRSEIGCQAAKRLTGLRYYESGLRLKVLIDEGAISKQHEQDVIRCFELAIKAQYAPAHVALGDLLWERGETDAAIGAYQNGIKANYIGAYNTYAQRLASQNRLDEMVPIYQKAIQQYPNASNLVGLQIGLGTVLEKLKRFDEAATAYRKAIAIDSQSLYTYFSLGDVLQQQGKLEEALQIYAKAAEIVRPDSLASPGSVFSYAQVGDMLRDRGQYDLAIVTYQKALTIDQQDYKPDAWIGVTLRLQGKLDESVTAFERSIDRNPNFSYAYRELATTLRQQGKSKEAAAASSKADTIEADNLKTRMGL